MDISRRETRRLRPPRAVLVNAVNHSSDPSGSHLALCCREDSTVRRAIQTTVVCGLLLLARQAHADPVAVGDLLHLLGSDGNTYEAENKQTQSQTVSTRKFHTDLPFMATWESREPGSGPRDCGELYSRQAERPMFSGDIPVTIR